MPLLPPGIGSADRIVLFDGECVMCSAGARALSRADRRARFKLGTLQSPEGNRLLAWLGISTDNPDTFVVLEGPRYFTRSTACVRILWQLSAPLKLLAGMLWLIPKPVRDAAYRWVARNRFRHVIAPASCRYPNPRQQHDE